MSTQSKKKEVAAAVVTKVEKASDASQPETYVTDVVIAEHEAHVEAAERTLDRMEQNSTANNTLRLDFAIHAHDANLTPKQARDLYEERHPSSHNSYFSQIAKIAKALKKTGIANGAEAMRKLKLQANIPTDCAWSTLEKAYDAKTGAPKPKPVKGAGKVTVTPAKKADKADKADEPSGTSTGTRTEQHDAGNQVYSAFEQPVKDALDAGNDIALLRNVIRLLKNNGMKKEKISATVVSALTA